MFLDHYPSGLVMAVYYDHSRNLNEILARCKSRILSRGANHQTLHASHYELDDVDLSGYLASFEGSPAAFTETRPSSHTKSLAKITTSSALEHILVEFMSHFQPVDQTSYNDSGIDYIVEVDPFDHPNAILATVSKFIYKNVGKELGIGQPPGSDAIAGAAEFALKEYKVDAAVRKAAEVKMKTASQRKSRLPAYFGIRVLDRLDLADAQSIKQLFLNNYLQGKQTTRLNSQTVRKIVADAVLTPYAKETIPFRDAPKDDASSVYHVTIVHSRQIDGITTGDDSITHLEDALKGLSLDAHHFPPLHPASVLWKQCDQLMRQSLRNSRELGPLVIAQCIGCIWDAHILSLIIGNMSYMRFARDSGAPAAESDIVELVEAFSKAFTDQTHLPRHLDCAAGRLEFIKAATCNPVPHITVYRADPNVQKKSSNAILVEAVYRLSEGSPDSNAADILNQTKPGLFIVSPATRAEHYKRPSRCADIETPPHESTLHIRIFDDADRCWLVGELSKFWF